MKLLERHFEIALETPDGITKLRELILLLAMQGKLIEQNPKDEPVQFLLSRIHDEKNKLNLKIEQGNNSCTGLAGLQIPVTWKWQCLNNILVFGPTNGYSPRVVQYETPVRSLTLSATTTGKFKGEYSKFIPDNIPSDSHLWLRDGDILVQRGNTLEYVGVPAVYRGEPNHFIYPDLMMKLRVSREIDTNFIYFMMSSEPCRNFLRSHASGTSGTMPKINQATLKSLPIPVPPLAEQKRIVAKVEQLMSLCDKLETERIDKNNKRFKVHAAAVKRLLSASDALCFHSSWKFITKNFDELYSVQENVEELKKTILQLAVMGKLVPQDPKELPTSELLKEIAVEKARLMKAGKIKKQESPPPIKPEEMSYAIPRMWEWVRLSGIGRIFNGNSLNDQQKSIYSKNNSGLPYISTKHVGYGADQIDYLGEIIIPLNEDKFRVAHKNALLICSEGGSAGKKIGLIDRDVYFGNKLIANEVYPNVDVKLIFYIYQSPYFQDLFRAKMTGIIGGIPFSAFLNMPIPLPPPAEQKRIVAKIDQLMELCNTLGQQIKDSTIRQTAILDSVLARL
ncbi:MAG: hypothetical protein CVU55_05545 [Deltaproteobacteria bacterium HGW-Deltaproteobacteria-13]|jgi:type I restriction enzyme S subunit|nr:MAG: hypothetical protein CVU55_05545 [Deltaproteobacteria bacterium HGW-Deltaproteobacteria-13]